LVPSALRTPPSTSASEKRKFYYLLDEHPELAEACFYIGTRRLWRIATLDAWMERQVAKGQPKKREAA
jgi:hypothetical protein